MSAGSTGVVADVRDTAAVPGAPVVVGGTQPAKANVTATGKAAKRKEMPVRRIALYLQKAAKAEEILNP
jgi:hypothetical protein